ncbi:MAG: CtsR family transcriptional regulator [Saccharofermentanales bacterium]
MARLSDVIELMIRGMLEENHGLVEIARNELANRMKCVPSQINYVISTRFTNQQGYYVESKRGGGGGIRITQIPMNTSNHYLMHLLNSMDADLSEHKASLYLKELQTNKIISEREAVLFESLISDKVFSEIPIYERLPLRSKMMKNLITCLMVQMK